MRRLGWVVLAVLAPLLLWHVDTAHTPNPTSRALLTISLVEDHSYRVDRFKDWTEDKAFIDGHYYSDKAPLASWLAVPVYALSSSISGSTSTDFPQKSALYSGALISGVIPSLIFIFLLWLALRQSGASPVLSVLYVFAAVPCSMVGLYAGTFFGHVLGGLLLVIAWRETFQLKRPLFAGLALGLTGCAEFPLLLFIPFLAIAAVFEPGVNRQRRFGLFLLGLVPGILLIGVHNLLTTGSILEFAYKHVDSPSFQHMKTLYGFKLPQWKALWGLLFSLSHGLLFHVPVLLTFALVFRGGSSVTIQKLGLKAVAILSYILLVSSYQMWEGGWAFGPRHLIPVAMVLLFEGAWLIPSKLNGLWAAALASSGIGGGALVFLAKSTVLYMIPPQYGFPALDLLVPKWMEHQFNSNVLPTILLGVSPLFSHLLWAHALILGGVWLCRQAMRLESSS